MRIKFYVQNPGLLEDSWKEWIVAQNIVENDDNMTDLGMEMQPEIWSKTHDGSVYEYGYITHTGNGSYKFDPINRELYFEGLRNSFGKTAYFNICRNRDGDIYIQSKVGGEKIGLELLEFCTSKPGQKFWLFDYENAITEQAAYPSVDLEKSIEIRSYSDVVEHKHASRDYWHPILRIHAKNEE